MPRALTRVAYWVCVASIGVSLAGCAETTYPTLPGLPTGGDSLLTPSEQEKAIKDLAATRSRTGETGTPATSK